MKSHDACTANPAQFLQRLFDIAVQAAQPKHCLPPWLPSAPLGQTRVIGAGKAAAAMAQAVEANWPKPVSGLVVTRYGHGADCRHIEVLEAAHPVPDKLGVRAARRMLDAVSDLTPDDLVLALISGGGSALLTLPAPGITLADQQTVSNALLRSGAPITDINTVRTHLSAIKGGQLAAAAAPAPVVTLIISDVPGDNPAWVASGPTVANPTTPADALAIVRRHDIDIPQRVLSHLERSKTRHKLTSLNPNNRVTIIATASNALAAAHQAAENAGVAVRMLGTDLQGEARELGRQHGLLAREIQATGIDHPLLLLSGGETSVTVNQDGHGGPNTEYLLGLALVLDGTSGIHALAADTDGIDGSENNAGAVLHPDTLARARAHSMDAATCLANNNAYGFFSGLNDLLITGPTRTNVNDFRAILIQPCHE